MCNRQMPLYLKLFLKNENIIENALFRNNFKYKTFMDTIYMYIVQGKKLIIKLDILCEI